MRDNPRICNRRVMSNDGQPGGEEAITAFQKKRGWPATAVCVYIRTAGHRHDTRCAIMGYLGYY